MQKLLPAASSENKLAAAKRAGADHLINYSEGNIREKIKNIVGSSGIDVLYDPVGGELFEPCLRSLCLGRKSFSYWFCFRNIPKLPTNLTLVKGCSVVGVFGVLSELRKPKRIIKILKFYLNGSKKKGFTISFSKVFPRKCKRSITYVSK